MPLGPQNIDLAASLAELRKGNLPLRARMRLAEEAGPHKKLFTSDLTVNEFLLTEESGVEPISQVMGSSIYHIGRIGDYKGKTGEIEGISQAHREARRMALYRLWQEASLVGADCVIAVRLKERLITKGAHGKGGDDGDEVIEFTAVGTAARVPFLEAMGIQRGNPIVTDLNGQDFWALTREGYVPCGLVFDFCRYHVWHVLGQQGGYTFQQFGEVTQASQGIEMARRLVAERVTQKSRELGATMVVGSDITVRVHEVPCGWPGCHLNDLDIDVAWFATAIRHAANYERREEPDIPPLILGMMKLGRGRKDELVDEEDDQKELEEQARQEEEKAVEKDDEGEE